MRQTFRVRFAGIIGNILEHYDSALFALLVPFIAPLFFDDQDALMALIRTYGILALGIITRPIGSLCFGWMGDRFGRKQALSCSLLGMAVVTVSMGCLPLYRDVGVFSPILLALGRMLQGFFAAGETSGGAIFVLEHTKLQKRSLLSGFYDASSIGGILIASSLVTLLGMQGTIEESWRFLFWGGGITAFLGIFLRLKTYDSSEFTTLAKISKSSLFKEIKEHRSALLSIILASGFSYTTYSLAFTLMNGLVPLVTSLHRVDVMKVNTLLLVIDMLLLPCFGFLGSKFGNKKVMLFGALLSAAAALPLFFFLEGASFGMVIFIRVSILLFGVAFAAPYHAWAMERVPPQVRYTILSLGCCLGSQVIGAPTSAVCLWLYKEIGYSIAPGFYLMIIAAAAAFVVAHSMKNVIDFQGVAGEVAQK